MRGGGGGTLRPVWPGEPFAAAFPHITDARTGEPVEKNQIEEITRIVVDTLQREKSKGDGFLVPVGVSARHIHLTQEDVETLFGPGYQLTKKKELMGDSLPPTSAARLWA